MTATVGENPLRLVIASKNESKNRRLINAFTKHTAIGLVGINCLPAMQERFNPIETGLPYESDRAHAKAQMAQQITGQASLGWDDGMYIQTKPFPGPDIKAKAGDMPQPEQLFQYYQRYFKELPPEKRKGHIKRAICVVDEKGTPYFTTKIIPFRYNDKGSYTEGGNPLDSLIIPQGYEKPFSEFTNADRVQYDQHLTEAVEEIKAEKDKRDKGVETRRSIKMNESVWVFSRKDMHLYNPEDEEGVARLAGILDANYAGMPRGWVGRKYGTASENDELDPNGFFTKRRGLLLIGESGDPKAMLSWVVKRGGSLKTNALRVADSHLREGLGNAIKNEMLLMGEAVGVRKMYCTTSRQNTAALELNKRLGYVEEAEFPRHYHLQKDEVILGKMLREVESTADKSKAMLLPQSPFGGISVKPLDVNKDGSEFRALIQSTLTGWHDDVGDDFVGNTMNGAIRGVEDVHGKGKFILFARDAQGNVCGTAVLTLKMGGPAKIYPLVGTAEAQVKLLDEIIKVARKLQSHVVYTFSPEWDKAEAELLKEIGFSNRGEIEAPYKPGANLIPWSMHFNYE